MKCIGVVLGIAGSLVLSAAGAWSQQVTLRATDGSAEFSGELVDFNGTVYTIRTRLGTLNIPASEVSCFGDDCPASNRVSSEFKIAGDRSILRGAIPELLDAYSLEVDTDIARERTADDTLAFQLLSLDGDPVVSVEFVEADSTAAFQRLQNGEATLVVTSRQITDDEAATLTGRDRRALDVLGLEHVIGLDGLVAIVGKDVGIPALSVSDLAAIYAGEITNWSALGGPDAAISIFTREPGSGVREALERKIMAASGKAVAANVIAVDSNSGVANAVQTFPNSIGITSFGAAGDNRMLAVSDNCGNQVTPNEFSIKSETYPLSVRVYLYEGAGGVPVHARGMVDFAGSDLGQQVIEDTGYMDLRPATAVAEDGIVSLMDAAADRVAEQAFASLEELRNETAGAERLSSTFRLTNAEGQLDGRGKVDLQQLVRMVRSGRLDGQELLFVGFAGPDAADRNAGLNQARAVVRQLFETDRSVEEQITVGFRILGYGGIGIDTCQGADVAEAGRVEVWIKALQQG